MVLRFGLHSYFLPQGIFSTIRIIKKECELFEEKRENPIFIEQFGLEALKMI